MDASVRAPVVAGSFYPGDREHIERELDRHLSTAEELHPLLACIAPHAGWMYSGGVAGSLFGHLEMPRRVVLLGPNHTGIGASVAVSPHSQWDSPAGPVPVDRELATRLVDASSPATADDRAHRREHSLEVLTPFLLGRRSDVCILPICVKHLPLETCLEIGTTLAAVIEEVGEPVGIVASSDMSHYQPDETARRLDRMAIDAALTLDAERLYETVHAHDISMCGVIPATIALAAAVKLGATGAHLVTYATSGDVSGDRTAVVGYAGICVHR
mgnify:CR=1 FL=1